MSLGYRAFLSCAIAVALAGCAPRAIYRGPVPAPGAVAIASRHSQGDATLPGAGEGVPDRLRPSGGDAARHWLGSIPAMAESESLVVLLYGDNRPGFRMERRSREINSVLGLKSLSPGRWLRGIVFLPILLAESIVPTLDGPRDVVTLFTQRPTAGREKTVLGALERAMPADLVISTGDIVTDGRRGRLWEDFVERHADLRRRVLYLGAPGNHERTSSELGAENWNASMGEPASPGRYWFAMDAPEAEALFVFLDSNVFTDAGRRYPAEVAEELSEAQLAWADSMLATPARHRFVMLHHPLVEAGHHRDWYQDEPRRRRARLLEILARRRVTAVFCGHEHLYQRVYVRAKDGSGFWHVTTGGAGSPLHWVSGKDWRRALAKPLPAGLEVDPQSAFLKRVHHYCLLALPRPGGNSDTIALEVHRVLSDGSAVPMDSFDLARPPRGAEPE